MSIEADREIESKAREAAGYSDGIEPAPMIAYGLIRIAQAIEAHASALWRLADIIGNAGAAGAPGSSGPGGPAHHSHYHFDRSPGTGAAPGGPQGAGQ